MFHDVCADRHLLPHEFGRLKIKVPKYLYELASPRGMSWRVRMSLSYDKRLHFLGYGEHVIRYETCEANEKLDEVCPHMLQLIVSCDKVFQEKGNYLY